VNKGLKYTAVLLFAFFLALPASAQLLKEDTTTNAPFFAAKKFDSKCYVGFEAIPTQILKNKFALNLGLSLNWVINHKFVLSAKYHGLTTPVNIAASIEPVRTDTVHLVHHFAGLAFSYLIFHDRKFSLQPELAAGWGSMRYTYANEVHRKDFGVLIPAFYGVWNAHKNFRMGIGLNYRLALGASLNGLTSADLSGVGGVVFIRVGTF
jgi:hypothetical protein